MRDLLVGVTGEHGGEGRRAGEELTHSVSGAVEEGGRDGVAGVWWGVSCRERWFGRRSGRRGGAGETCECCCKLFDEGGGVGGTAGERGGDSISLGVRRAEEAKGRGRWGGEVGIGVPEEEGGEEGRDFDCVCRRFANSWRTGEGRGRSS